MATYTPNYNLSKPESTDDMTDFFADYGDNMDIIDENMGGGGSGGHTIIDENDVSMTQRTGLQFTGNVSVTDDAVNDKTIVDISGGDVADVEVNGISVVDAGTKIAEITSYEEVTLAEYESIPVADRESNGVAYFIKDLNNSNVQGYPPLIYSDEEREIGVWRDGKPLYQITKNIGQLTQDTNFHTVSHGIANIDKVVDVKGIMIMSASPYRCYPIPISRPNTSPFQGVMISVNATEVQYMNNWQANAHTGYVTFQYTKTTDTAGSGTWNGQGGIAHHYSTNETVVGTFLGKTLYERTFNFTFGVVSDWALFDSSVSYEYLVSAKGFYILATGEVHPFVSQGSLVPRWVVKSDHKAYYYTNIARSGYVTLQYTKT